MKRLDRESLFLYSIHLLLEGAGSIRYDREDLASALVLSQATFDLYLSKLKTKGLVESRKRLYNKEIGGNISITGPGSNRVRRIERSLKGRSLTEKDHNIPGPIELNDLLDRLKVPLDRVFLLNLYNHNPSFDLTAYLMVNDLSKDDTMPLFLVHSMDGTKHARIANHIRNQLFNASLYGNISRKMLSSAFSEGGSDDALLLLLEVNIRMGRLYEANLIHEHMRSVSDRLSPAQRSVMELSHAELLGKKHNRLAASQGLKNALKGEKNTFLRVILGLKYRYMTALHSRRKLSDPLFEEELRLARSIGDPLLLTVVYEHRGSAFLEQGDLESSEENLLRAKMEAMQAGSSIAEANALIGLSKLTLLRGKYDLSMSYLRKAKTLYERCSVLEPVSRTEFLMALLELERGRSKQARRHYRSSLTVSFPLPCPATLREYDEELKRVSKRRDDPSLLDIIYSF